MNTPTEQKWLADLGPSVIRDFHPMTFGSIRLTVASHWAANEPALIQRLARIVARYDTLPTDRRENGILSGYRWQLDDTNDWWAELEYPEDDHDPDVPRRDESDGSSVLIIAYRYNDPIRNNRVRAVGEWAAMVFGGRVIHPPVHSLELSRKGGEWLGAARRWMQSRFANGSDVTWGSNDLLRGDVTVHDIEDLAATVAAATLRERNQGRI